MLLRNASGPVPGTQDLHEPGLAALQHTRGQIQDFLWSYGYRTLEVPVLEDTDLYLRKLGSQVAASLFTFVDQRGSRLCLRPEFTGSVIRHYIQHAQELPLPVRWQYCGPVFRDQETPSQQLRQFTQLGAELIGPASSRADAELLALACKGLQRLNLPQPRVVIGHAGLLPSLLNGFQLPERVKMYVASHVELLREGSDGMAKLRQGLEELKTLPIGGTPVTRALSRSAEAEEVTSLVRWFLDEGTTRPLGRRTPEEILQRFQTKLHGAENPEHLEHAVALAKDLAPVRAAPEQALVDGQRIIEKYGLDQRPLQKLGQVIELLSAQELGNVTLEVDLGLTRALGYYTGIVFELFLDAAGQPPVGGGGRYDGLVRALGGAQDVPTLGFAYTLESLVAHLPEPQRKKDAAPTGGVLVVPEQDSDFPAATSYAEAVRNSGGWATVEVMGWTAKELDHYCRAAGIERLALVGTGGVRETLLNAEVVPYAPAGAP